VEDSSTHCHHVVPATRALWRAKQIQYASRSAHHVDAVATKINLRHAMRLLKAATVPDVAAVPADPVLTARRLDIVNIVYRPDAGQIPASDAEFSCSSIADRRAAGYRDMTTALAAQPWLQQEMPAHLGALVHRVERDKVITRPEAPAASGRLATLTMRDDSRPSSQCQQRVPDCPQSSGFRYLPAVSRSLYKL
jgi:hypothetical protein